MIDHGSSLSHVTLEDQRAYSPPTEQLPLGIFPAIAKMYRALAQLFRIHHSHTNTRSLRTLADQLSLRRRQFLVI